MEINFEEDSIKIIDRKPKEYVLIFCVLNVGSLLDFNINTGVISNPLYLGVEAAGVAFSESGDYLYCNDRNQSIPMWQFDLNANDILASKTFIGNANDWNNFGQMLLAPNGKIYVTEKTKHTLGVIHSPETAGMASNYVPSDFYLSYKYNSEGLPHFANTYSRCSDVSVTKEQKNEIQIYPNPVQRKFQITNCPSSAEIQIFSTDLKPIAYKRSGNHIIFNQQTAAGIYFVQVVTSQATSVMKIICE